jgi:hypothetical protein
VLYVFLGLPFASLIRITPPPPHYSGLARVCSITPTLAWRKTMKDLIGFEGLTAVVMKITIFWDIMARSPSKVNRCFWGIYRLHLQGQRISRARYQRESSSGLPPAFTLVSCSAYSSTLKMEAIYFSETSVDFQRTTRRYIPQDGTLHERFFRTAGPWAGIWTWSSRIWSRRANHSTTTFSILLINIMGPI